MYVDHQKTQAASQRATFIMKTNDRFISILYSLFHQISSLFLKPSSNKSWEEILTQFFVLFQEVLIDSAEPGGDENLGGCALHRGRGLPGVPGPRLTWIWSKLHNQGVPAFSAIDLQRCHALATLVKTFQKTVSTFSAVNSHECKLQARGLWEEKKTEYDLKIYFSRYISKNKFF